MFMRSRTPRHESRTLRSVVALVVVAVPLSTVGLVMAVGARSASAAAPTYTWPEFHNSPALSGVSADPTISTSNASTLGVKWMSPLGPSLDSPMVAYNRRLRLTLAFTGGAAGYFEAVNVKNGQIIWSDDLHASVSSSPLVENGYVWVAPQGMGRFYKLDAATGAIECSATVTNSVLSTPVIATPPGGVKTVYLGSLGSGAKNGPVAAYAESDCAELWNWSSYIISGEISGTWAPLSYGVDANGVGLVIVGSANPDSAVYALNAATGALVWSYSTYCPTNEDWDVGAGTDVSAPGVNGFADGMAYVEGKDGIFNALDLTTGALVWSYNFGGNSASNPKATDTDALSTPALSGTTLVFGDAEGLYALNAVTGAKIWFRRGEGDINSSPAIVGPPGKQVVAYGDLNGHFRVARLSTGKVLYTYVTGNYITSSPADVDGNLLVESDDGFLYDFDLGGANSPLPTTDITSPTAGSSVANPNGSLTISGTASASDGVGAVTVQVQMDGSTGPWFDQSTGTFAAGLSTASATLSSPGATSTNWSLSLPVPAQAASYQILASAVGVNRLADRTAYSSASNADSVQFNVQASSSAPVVKVSPARINPGGKITISARGFAPGETVTFTAPLANGKTVALASLKARQSGDTRARTVTISTSVAFGPDPITATGETSGRVGESSVYVSNNDPQFGYGPLHQGYESNDTVIRKYQGVGGSSKLALGWTVAGQGAFDTTPAVDEGLIYFGDKAGNFYAVDQTSGNPVFTLAIGSPVESSPAVDGGSVFFGDDAGKIYAVNASTGVSVWSTSIGGEVSSPAVAGGVVYVGTSSGDLVALDESTGAVDWTVSVGGSLSSAPAVDTGAGLAVATSSSGVVEAVSTATGTVAWTDSVGGAATGAMIWSRNVYVASSNGSLFALAETTGNTDWSVSTGSAISAAPILGYGSLITVGTAAGNVSYYRSSGAHFNTQTQFGKPITGLTYSGSELLLTSSSGELALIQGDTYLKITWHFQASTGFVSPGVILNGDVFVLGEGGLLRAFTTPGRSVT